MKKSQFNIKISSELLKQIKMQAMRSGKSLTDHITELIEMSLKKTDPDSLPQIPLERIKKIENRLFVLEASIEDLKEAIPDPSCLEKK